MSVGATLLRNFDQNRWTQHRQHRDSWGQTGMNVRSFWGKAQPSDAGRRPEWHPLAFHCLDVAAVGEALLMQHRGLGSHLPHLLGLPGDYTLRLVCFLLSLHDIGKFAKKFQAKLPG